jgi:fructokinase
MKKILCVGEALIDMICSDIGSSLSNGEHFLKKPGGAPTNVAAAIASLGGEVELAAKVGVDPFGLHLIDVMKSFGVSTKWMLKDENHFTTFAFVSLLENGERDFYFNRGADGHLSDEDLSNIDLDEFSIIHFGSATAFLPGPLQLAYHNLFQKAIQQKKIISFDPNYRHLLFNDKKESFIQQSNDFIKNSNFFKLSDEEAMLLSGCGHVNDAAVYFHNNSKAVFAITLGKEGTLLGFNQQSIIIPSIKINSIDSTGAGDAFVGAVLYQLNNYKEEEINSLNLQAWEKIIYHANLAGAKTCEYMGAMEAFKQLNKQIFNV